MFDIKIVSAKKLKEIRIIEPAVNYDERGSIFTTYEKKIYNKFLPEGFEFIHDKFAESKNNVLRGLHGDSKTWKLISCIYGSIYEVVVDMRENSPTFLNWEAFELNSENKRQIIVPPNFVNGYYVKSDFAVFHYKLAYKGEYFDVEKQTVVRWNDVKINIDWPCTDPILQMRDR